MTEEERLLKLKLNSEYKKLANSVIRIYDPSKVEAIEKDAKKKLATLKRYLKKYEVDL